ncbi:MarR family winged helix-turn-helix transcriptional regulator [Nocardia sp.]|uniref:MarR family winged helix-turn-helix transcriptional regulator n=1 Tax=Nocardia sp. TaxID=1821 RepID=UPI002608F4B7|nr:MarR family winged helix-turn-helix transcriptional regulator [Nocardia sp.]
MRSLPGASREEDALTGGIAGGGGGDIGDRHRHTLFRGDLSEDRLGGHGGGVGSGLGDQYLGLLGVGDVSAREIAIAQLGDGRVPAGHGNDVERIAARVRGCLASDLAGHFHLDKSTVSRQVAALEHLGYLTKEIDPADRRNHVLQAIAAAGGLLEPLRAAGPRPSRNVCAIGTMPTLLAWRTIWSGTTPPTSS